MKQIAPPPEPQPPVANDHAARELEKRVTELTRELDRQRRHNEELHTRHATATAAYRNQGELLAHVSHEIRSLIQLTTGTVELLRQTTLNRQQEEYLCAFQHSNQQLLALTNDILDAAKLEAGRFRLEETELSLDELLAGATRLLAWEAGRKGLSFEVLIDDSVPRQLRGDPKRLQQVLTNLIGNAVKFTRTGGVTLQIDYQAPGPATAAMLRFTVADTGIGIPNDQLREIFDRFVQSSPATARLHGGTGLGLAIARDLVTLMGGEIAVESSEGHGSRFIFTVPLPPDRPGRPAVSRPEQESPAADRQLSVLLAEDSAEIRLLLGAFLSRAAHRVDFAADGAEAVAMATSKRYEVVLMDMQMPILDGYLATSAIRDWERQHGLPEVPILALTAAVERSDHHRCREAGCSGHLAKPIRQEALLRAIREIAV
ncbi:hybrid sensor histidine kinase/response regulator [Geotalea uraniireducens]|uniref:histidine kinase n=1 Tax=Geotalea uraniireducens TaxID=351604 RepID=A0ABN6VWY6_9BACT|nr:ATP-binding protein [Geotalea uraniireducens]BDV42855.1 hybrid sensor histidine kinase/response regulator [Geotalea uraniireducens]